MLIPKVIMKLLVQKAGEARKDCNDRIAINERVHQYAVADGATRSFLSSIWAELLVKYFCSDKYDNDLIQIKKDWRKWLAVIQKKWRKHAETKVAKNKKYYLINRLNQNESAVSTFVGIEFKNEGQHLSWQAMIVGDTCLFHLRFKNKKYRTDRYLLKKASQFDSFPEYFASYEKDNKYEPSFIEGTCQQGDYFIIATDALAQWIMSYIDLKNKNPLKILERLTEETIDKLRKNKSLKLENDDVAILILEVTKA